MSEIDVKKVMANCEKLVDVAHTPNSLKQSYIQLFKDWNDILIILWSHNVKLFGEKAVTPVMRVHRCLNTKNNWNA